MKRLLKIFLVALLGLVAWDACAFCHSERSEESLDSTVKAALDRKLAEYFSAIEREGVQVQKGECDFLIESCADSLMRQHVALTAYEHYRDSKVMGSEAVAIYIFDNWIDPGKVKMRDGMELMAAKIFAEFNRESMIGNKAPELLLYDMDNNPVSVFDTPSGRYTVLYFYDTSCATCKVQTILLRNLFGEEDFPVDFIAVYAADNMDSWRKYAGEQLDFGSKRTRVRHMWDPEMDSDFQRLYGVLQTPRMFLISPDGTIVGRGLDAQALSQMLHALFDEVEMEYGSDESMDLYDGLFGGEEASEEDVTRIADYIQSNTLAKGDTLMFKQMTGDLMYYLTLQRGEGYREGLDALINDRVLSRPDVWKTSDDSLKVIGMAEMFQDLLLKSAPGKRVADMKVPGVLFAKGKESAGVYDFRKLRGESNYVMFVTDGCHVCAAEKEAARRLVAEDKKAKVLIVNMDLIHDEDPQLAERLLESFDLSSLPFIIKTDRKGRITRRYTTLIL